MKIPTIADVAREARVSIATVSRVMSGNGVGVRPGTARRVMTAIELLDYRPQSAGRALRSKRTNIVAVIIPDVLNTLWAAVASSIETALRDQHKMMFLCNSMGDPEVQDLYIKELRSYAVAEVVIAGAVRSAGLETLVQGPSSVVFVNRKAPIRSAAPFLGIDNYMAGRDVAEHFMARDYRPCAMLHGPMTSSVSVELFGGFRDTLQMAGQKVSSRHVREAPWTPDGGYHGARDLLSTDPPPRAILCGSDMIAYGVHRYCQEAGLRVPEDLAIFGYDDNPFNEWLAPWLSTIRIPYRLIGPAVCRLLEALRERPGEGDVPQIILPHEMVLRTSA